jgi:hypothetical protein
VQKFYSIFSQLLQLSPRLDFEEAVGKHNSDSAAKGFSGRRQFVDMLFCQFGRAHNLREICGRPASCEGKFTFHPTSFKLEGIFRNKKNDIFHKPDLLGNRGARLMIHDAKLVIRTGQF